MVAFGWHMHPLFDLRYEFPYHRGLRPIFVSFHVNRLEMLTRGGPRVPASPWTGRLPGLVDRVPPAECRSGRVLHRLPHLHGRRRCSRRAARPSVAATWWASSTSRRAAAAGRCPSGAPVHPSGRRVPLPVRGRGSPGGARAARGIPARPRAGRHRAAARLPAAHLARRPGGLPTEQPWRRPVRRGWPASPRTPPSSTRCARGSGSCSRRRSRRSSPAPPRTRSTPGGGS